MLRNPLADSPAAGLRKSLATVFLGRTDKKIQMRKCNNKKTCATHTGRTVTENHEETVASFNFYEGIDAYGTVKYTQITIENHTDRNGRHGVTAHTAGS